MKLQIFLIIIFSIIIINGSCKTSKNNDELYVAFWNLENLFDTVDDPGKIDEEFLPSGEKEWTNEKLEKKLKNLSKVISAMNDENGPDILGVCEVEHERLLQELISKNLPDKNYKIAYAESPDRRGIDNGLIFNADKFSLISINPISIDDLKSRFILEVTLLLKNNKDTLLVLVNHWPSRRGGELESEPKRMEAAKTVKKIIENSSQNNHEYKLIIIGDFNDQPTNSSILNELNARPLICDSTENENIQSKQEGLFNLAYNDYKNGIGSFKYRDEWDMIDQIIISNNLLDDDIKYVCGSFKVFKPEFMVEKSGKYKGTPFPTFGGKKYLGGYSDHFPVEAKFKIKGEQ